MRSRNCFATLPLLIAVVTAGCASGAKKNEEALAEALPGKTKSSFRNMATYPGNVTCGQYLDLDYQGYPIYQWFVVVDTIANMRPSPADVRVFCTDDSKQALNEEFKIDFDSQKETILAVMADFKSLEQPLLDYEKANRYFPSTEQGLQALVSPAEVGNYPRNFPEGGYLPAIPQDPWGQPYDYTCDPFGGIRVIYKLRSLGADGKPGGTGLDVDLKFSQMKYFDHVNNL